MRLPKPLIARLTVGLCGLLTTMPLAQAFEARFCPRELQGTNGGVVFHGVILPQAATDFPLINTGRAVYEHTKSEKFLVDALNLLCREGEVKVDCGSPVASGTSDATTEVFDVWQTQAASPTATDELAACRDYARLTASLAEALLPENVALVSSPYSSLGMTIRRTFWKLIQIRPALEARARFGGADVAALRQLLDDLKFAEFLADKLSSDAKLAIASPLLDEIKRITTDLDSAPLNTLLTIDRARLSDAIQKSL